MTADLCVVYFTELTDWLNLLLSSLFTKLQFSGQLPYSKYMYKHIRFFKNVLFSYLCWKGDLTLTVVPVYSGHVTHHPPCIVQGIIHLIIMWPVMWYQCRQNPSNCCPKRLNKEKGKGLKFDQCSNTSQPNFSPVRSSTILNISHNSISQRHWNKLDWAMLLCGCDLSNRPTPSVSRLQMRSPQHSIRSPNHAWPVNDWYND